MDAQSFFSCLCHGARLPPGAAAGLIFCLDMANNHQGSVEHGKQIITGLAAVRDRTGAQILVKMQSRDLETILHPADRCPAALDPAPLTQHAKRFRETSLSRKGFEELVDCARACNLPIYTTPFDENSVDLCVELGFDLIKVASCSALDWPLLRKIAATGLPTVVSTGGLKLNEVDDVVDFFGRKGTRLALMHCVSSYPTACDDIQMDCVRQLKERFPEIPLGYSGHEQPADMDVVELAVAKGAEIHERHVGQPSEKIKLNKYSLSIDEAEVWIRKAQRAAAACANGQPRRPAAGESDALSSLRRGIYARRTIPAGHTIAAEDVFLAMPCLPGQFHASKYYEIVDFFTPMEPIPAHMPIGLGATADLPKGLLLSSIAAQIEEMLSRARISLDEDAAVELSHQYGFQRFFEVGAVLIDVVNRDYCKKILIQFPGQSHPSHRHLEKEETFQVLSGSMHVVVGGAEHTLQPGQKMLVERGVFHSFSTETGVIFEEVSTTHIKGDSQYEDQAIPSDPAARKTRIVLPTLQRRPTEIIPLAPCGTSISTRTGKSTVRKAG